MMTATAAPPPIMKPRELAQYLGKSLTWVQRKAADGTLPHRKVGRDLRFIRTEIDAWLNRQGQ